MFMCIPLNGKLSSIQLSLNYRHLGIKYELTNSVHTTLYNYSCKFFYWLPFGYYSIGIQNIKFFKYENIRLKILNLLRRFKSFLLITKLTEVLRRKACVQNIVKFDQNVWSLYRGHTQTRKSIFSLSLSKNNISLALLAHRASNSIIYIEIMNIFSLFYCYGCFEQGSFFSQRKFV